MNFLVVEIWRNIFYADAEMIVIVSHIHVLKGFVCNMCI